MNLRFLLILIVSACPLAPAAEPTGSNGLEGGSPVLLSSPTPAPPGTQDPKATDEPPHDIAARVNDWQEMRLEPTIRHV